MSLLRWAGAIALACSSVCATAQTFPRVSAPSTFVPPSAAAFTDTDGQTRVASTATPLPVAGRAETARLAIANVPSQAASLYGGSYVLSQACTGYGTVTLRYLAADGITMTALVSKTAADTNGGSPVSLGSSAIVDVVLSGTTGCNVSLSRIP